MANVNVTSDAWTEISITSGTIQNISATADIELSAEQTDNSGVVLKPSELYQWDNETIYARAVTEDTGALRVVNFKKAAGGGGYVLPVASNSTLGGVKVGSNLSIDENGVLSATGGGGTSYSKTEQVIGTWIDGKPLYQKTYEATTPATSGTDASIITFDANMIIHSMDGYIQNSTIFMPINMREGNTNYVLTYCAGNEVRMNQYLYNSCPCFITLRYTKSTD